MMKKKIGDSKTIESNELCRALYRISEATVRAVDLNSLLSQIHLILADFIPARNFYAALYDEHKKIIHFPYFVDEIEDDLPKPETEYFIHTLGLSMTGYVIRMGKTVNLIPEVYEQLYENGEVMGYGQPSVYWLGVPFKTAQCHTIGMMAVQSYTEGEPYGTAAVELMEFAANQITVFFEHMRVTDALRKSEDRLNLALDAVKLGLWELNLPAGELTTTPQFCENAGYTSAELSANSHRSIIHPDDANLLFDKASQSLKGGNPCFDIEYRVRTKDGDWRWLHDYCRVVDWDEKGKPTRILGANREISNRKLAENRLRRRDTVLEAVSYAAEKFLKSPDWELEIDEILEHLGIGSGADSIYIFRIHKDSSDAFYFSQAHEWTTPGLEYQQNRSELLNISANHPGYTRWKTEMLDNKIIQGKVSDFPEAERMIYEPQGIISLAAAPIFVDKNWWGYIGFYSCSPEKDVSQIEGEVLRLAADILGAAVQNKHVEGSLRKSEAHQRAILDALPDLIFILDADGVYQECFSNDHHLLVMPRSELIGKSLVGVLPESASTPILACVRKTIDTGHLQTVEYILPINNEEHSFESRMVCYGENTVLAIIRDVTERRRADKELYQMNEKLAKWVNELEIRNKEVSLLNKMGDMLQSCLTLQEAFDVIQQYAALIFEDTSGGFYLLNEAKSMLEPAAVWGRKASLEAFPPDLCWALRRGRVHMVPDPERGLNCQHLIGVEAEQKPPYLCVPMIAQGETLGLLFICATNYSNIKRWETLAISSSEQVALSISNLKLRQLLQMQSVRDGLTNLFNRRYMQETLERELSRARRYGQPLSIAMADIDHFKNYNDSLGHEAGDIALQEIAVLIASNIRKEDFACRYGGDELAIILPGASPEESRERIDQCRQAVKRLRLRGGDENSVPLTISFGISGYPGNGATIKEVLNAADQALYDAKQQGRDTVRVARSKD